MKITKKYMNGMELKLQLTMKTSLYPGNEVMDIAITEGNKWIGTWGGGVAKFDGTNWTVYNKSNSGLPDNKVAEIAIDGEGNKWLGTRDQGLVKFDGTNWTIYNESNSGLPKNYISSIAIDQEGNKWIGTGGGVAVFNETGVSVEENRLTPQNIIIFPNPTQGKVKLSMETEMTRIVIFDLTGKEIMQIDEVQANKKSIDLSGKRAGVYLLNIHTDDQVITKKILKQ
ncbi:MAG: T9SS type A sorting domain-containing protein [Bacteroidales bacterium]